MQEKSLESTEIFKIFRGGHTPVLPSLFRSKHFMYPNPLQWNPATGLKSLAELNSFYIERRIFGLTLNVLHYLGDFSLKYS